MKLFIDTETTGIPNYKEPYYHPNQPHIVQLAAILTDSGGTEVSSINIIINNPDCVIPKQAVAIHGIDTEYAQECGILPFTAISLLGQLISKADEIIAHNLYFDLFMIEIAQAKIEMGLLPLNLNSLKQYCTMKAAMNIPGMPLNHAGGKKYPKLIEAYRHAFQEDFGTMHNAIADCRAMKRLYEWLKEQGL